MRLTADQRCLIGLAVDKIGNKTLVAKAFGVNRKTVYKWNKRRKYLKDRRRKPKKAKVTPKIELFILPSVISLGERQNTKRDVEFAKIYARFIVKHQSGDCPKCKTIQTNNK